MPFRARWIAIGVGVVLLAFGVLLAVQHRQEASVPRLVQEHGTVPGFSVTTLDGKTIDAATLRNKTVVVNFFNSWCIPCHQEAPALRAFYAAHKNDPDFQMIGIVHDDEEGAVRKYVRDEKIDYPVALDPKGSAALGFGTTGQPETYVIAPDGVAACGALGASSLSALNTWVDGVRAGAICK
jgi:peroxiredoxin